MTILDNRVPQTRVGTYLREQLSGDAETLRIVSAYFTVYAYQALRDRLENIEKIRFLYGDPDSVSEIDPGEKEGKGYDLTERGLLPTQVFKQKHAAKDCAKWIEDHVEVRTIKKTNFLHGKMYCVERKESPNTAVVGSSNFTYRGLGFDAGANLEINLTVTETAACDELKQWFDDIWQDKGLTRDAKREMLDALNRLGRNYSPELVYFKTLLEIFRERMEAREETDNQIGVANLKDTKIWKTLYQFQRDGVTGIINRLEQYNGCILADSVGLGKTYTALAVIRYYQAKNQRVLVLCPKKLSENWKLYSAMFGQRGNPFLSDNFNYTLLHHTDLSRLSGESNGISLVNFDWSAYGLVVIDESHNFRNESSSVRDEENNIIRQSRYERLLQDVIQKGGQTKVLMLSATPVNTSLTDLRNQIYFMTGKREDTFKDTLGIGNIRAMLGVAQRTFRQWEQEGSSRQKRGLFDKLGGEFFALLDAVSIARSRSHVKNFYPEVVEKIGGFPVQVLPETEAPLTDSWGELSYEALNEEINKFRLSIYTPTAYVISDQVKQDLQEEKEKLNFNQSDREKWLIGMICVNFLKRLESSAQSLTLTLERTIDKIDKLKVRIDKFQNSQLENEGLLEYDWEHEEEDEEFIVNKARSPFHFKDLNLSQWLDHLSSDRAILDGVRAKVAAITPERDNKLISLKKRVQHKLENPSTDKDGRKNRKVLVFTAFKDTAEYLYKQVEPMVTKFGARCAIVAGDATQTTYGNNNFNDILTNFAPIGRGRFMRDDQDHPIPDDQPEIDILISTDCVSEGQNLQDCDLVVNYDIHWNPVRLIQRFGRIDRIGSRNREVRMVNYWPTQELDDYLKLQSRVEARMALVDAAATGDEPLANSELLDTAETELSFRDTQLHRLRNETLDIDDVNNSVDMSDFSLDDFLAQLMHYLEKNKSELEKMPMGVYTVADCVRKQENLLSNAAPGAIFCLRHKNPPKDSQIRSILNPYYLVYVRDDEVVGYNYMHAKQTLELFGELGRGVTKPSLPLCDAFDSETNNGQDMKKYDNLLDSVFKSVSEQFRQQEIINLGNRHSVLPQQNEQPRGAEDFELVTWLVIKDSDRI